MQKIKKKPNQVAATIVEEQVEVEEEEALVEGEETIIGTVGVMIVEGVEEMVVVEAEDLQVGLIFPQVGWCK